MYTEEIWKDIEGYEDRYQISNFGNVKSLQRTTISSDGKPLTVKEKILKHSVHKDGYHFVSLNKNGVKKETLIHRIVARAFIPNPNNKPEVNHMSGNKDDNSVFNLEWVDRSENMRHRIDILGFKGGLYGKLGALNKQSKIVQQIKNTVVIAEFYGSHEAERLTGISSGSIRACCRNEHRTAGGYVWRYKNT